MKAQDLLSTMQGNKHNIALYVPSTQDVDQPIDSKEQVDYIATSFAHLFGGFTITKAQGGRVSENVGLVKEGITIVTSSADDKSFDTNLTHAIDLAKMICKNMSQEAVMMTIDNNTYFVNA